MSEKTSKISGFYTKTHKERLSIIKEFANLDDKEISLLKNFNSLHFESANRMIENVVSVMPIPLGVATNFLINNADYLVPMALEEPSVIAAASKGAKLARFAGGFIASSSEPIMIGQIQLTNVKNIKKAISQIEQNKTYLIEHANKQDSVLVKLGGGALDIKTKAMQTNNSSTLIVELLVNVKDAMGANIVNTMTESIAPFIEKMSNGSVLLRILSNLNIYRTTKAMATWKKEILGQNVIENIIEAYNFAKTDPFRCATHNKGIMNGIDAVTIATGNDFRAIEAGAHAFATLNQKYEPLTKYHISNEGDLVGEIELPMAVGIIGGITQTHPIAKICLKILNVKSASELANIIASVGLAQNFSALLALVTEGIQRGHMKLHSKNIAITAGAFGKKIDWIAEQMCQENNISVIRAKELLENFKEQQQ
jgi:hydroxymethylglutaryl-CoA reductase